MGWTDCDLVVAAIQRSLDNANKVTKAQVRAFLDICCIKYLRAKIEPGVLHYLTLMIY